MNCQHVGHWEQIDGKTIRCKKCDHQVDLSTNLTHLERGLITLTIAVAGLVVVVNSYDIAAWLWEMML